MPEFNFERVAPVNLPQDDAQLNSPHSSSESTRHNLVAAIALRIRQSLNLDLILQQTVTEVRTFLQTDRVLIYRFEPDLSGVIAVESVVESDLSVVGHKLKDPCFAERHLERYQQGCVHAVDNVAQAHLHSCYKEVLQKFRVQSNLVVPIIASEELWGLLIVHHCHQARHWQQDEIELLRQLAVQVGIAVQQAELYERLRSFNTYLEQKIDLRTVNLQKSVQFESLTRKITEKMRDSLDELQILQTVTQEIGRVLDVERCKIELYNGDRTKAKVAFSYAHKLPSHQDTTRTTKDFPELEQQLLQKQTIQFVEVAEFVFQKTRLVCPIYDDRGVLGNLWLLRPQSDYFFTDEIRLVEQVADQCAIAIRQARLYQKAQLQVEELARLNRLKDDFLKTISHELRTPMSSIQLASETLEALLEREIGSNRSETFTKVLNIFRSACDRQNQLVNDLLTLCYVDAKKETLRMQWIDLEIWLPQIVEPFKARIAHQQQKLQFELPNELPQLKSDISAIDRILTELLNNACKYTPAGETISFKVSVVSDQIQVAVENTGAEIPPSEQQRVFDRFYRIPNRDPWQFGGTGIGLALVKRLIESLGGRIDLTSERHKTVFTLNLPLEQDSELN